MSLTIEHLPAEIWFYIFKCVEGHDLIRAFAHLNSFINSLLRSHHLQLHIRVKQNESNQRLPEMFWSQIVRQNIYSLSVGQRRTNCLIQFLRWNAQYLVGLHTLSIYLRKSRLNNNIQFLTTALKQISSLNTIHIKYPAKFDPNINYFEPLMTYIFSRKCLIQKCSFDFHMHCYKMKTDKWSLNSSIKYLTARDMGWIDLFSLLKFTPQLYSFRGEMKITDKITCKNFILINLKRVNLCLHRSYFVQLEKLKELAPNLQCLQLQGYFNTKDDNYFSENLWHKLLDNMKYFHVNLQEFVESVYEQNRLRSYIGDLHGKKWFSWEETLRSLYVYIKFTSVAI